MSKSTGDLQNWVNRFSDSCLMVLNVLEVLVDTSTSPSPTSSSRFGASMSFFSVGEYVQGSAE